MSIVKIEMAKFDYSNSYGEQLELKPSVTVTDSVTVDLPHASIVISYIGAKPLSTNRGTEPASVTLDYQLRAPQYQRRLTIGRMEGE